jgi:hypothetical protein
LNSIPGETKNRAIALYHAYTISEMITLFDFQGMARTHQLLVAILALFPLYALLIAGCKEADEAEPLKPSEHLLADVTLEYEIDNPDSISRTVVKIKGSRVRSD